MTDEDRAADALSRLDTMDAVQGGIDGANDMADAFERAGERIARSMEKAARRGELSVSDMVESVLTELARIAVSELIEGPLTALVDGLGQALGGGSGTTVNLNVTGATDPKGFQRSEGQIAASLARAVSVGSGRI